MDLKISPSDLTYLFDGCPYCFCLKVKHKIPQPSMPMPGIFSAIAGRQKEFYSGRRTGEFLPGIPAGTVEYAEQWVESKPITFPGLDVSCYIKGRFDMVIRFDAGGYAVIDCKTARPSEQKTSMYGRQLHAYSFALEHASGEGLSLTPVTLLGLLYFEPFAFTQCGAREQSFQGRLVWQEVERDDESFLAFMKQVLSILSSKDVLPGTCGNCEYCSGGDRPCLAGKQEAQEQGCTCCLWCSYRKRMEEFDEFRGLVHKRDITHPPCPLCGGKMILRDGRRGTFWSCVKYPDCRGARTAVTGGSR